MITVNSQGNPLPTEYATTVKDDERSWLARVSVNGTELSGDIISMTITKGSCGGSEFEVGAVMSSVLTLSMSGLTTNVKNQDIKAEIGLEINGAYEYITLGYFTATEVKKNHYTTDITAYGHSVSKTGDKLPALASQRLSDLRNYISSATGLSVNYDSAIDTSYEITVSLEGMTSYQTLQVIASVVGGYVKDEADGSISIKVYTDTPTLSVDAGMMVKLPDAEEVDFTITGLQCTVGEIVYTSGTPNVEMSNEYMTADLFNNVCAPNLVGYSYRSATINLTLGDPRLEGDDVLEVTDIDGSTYLVPCHSVTHKYTSGLESEIESMRATMEDLGEATPAPISSQIKKRDEQIARVDRIASNTNQYFWFTSTGTDTGAHITEVPQDEFTDPTDPNYQSGGNLLARSNGIAVRNGMTELSTFGTTGIVLGQSGQSRTEIDYHSLKLVKGTEQPYLHVSDLRNADGYASFETTATGDGETKKFYLGVPLKSSDRTQLNVYVDSVLTTDYSFYVGDASEKNSYIKFTTAPADGASILMQFVSSDSSLKAFTFGTRRTGRDVGLMSSSMGDNLEASGYASHAEGLTTFAKGRCSHAEGSSTHAEGTSSHAEGMSTYATGYETHAEGWGTHATGYCAHAEGYATHADGRHSHAGGLHTQATHLAQTVIGTYNEPDPSTESGDVKGRYAFILGNGDSATPSNALTIRWNGDVESKGKIKDTVTETTASFNRTGGYGTVPSAKICLTGHMAHLFLTVKNSNSTASGANIYEGEVVNSAYAPRINAFGCGYYGAHALIAIFKPDGSLIVRNASATAVAISDGAGISITYVVQEGV